MRNIIYIFLVFVLVFFLNLLLYIYVDSYRSFIKVLKYGNDSIPNELSVDDSYNVNSIEYSRPKSEAERSLLLDLWIEDDTPKEVVIVNREWSNIENSNASTTQNASQTVKSEREVVQSSATISRELRVTAVWQKIISDFNASGFEIIEKKDKDDLLDIAREYPDDYLQYGNNSFDLYILSTRTYDEVDDIFTVLEYEMPYTLNKTDTFWDRSFFINLDRPDEKVRFIFQYEWETYWVKVRTPNYNAVKSILNTL